MSGARRASAPNIRSVITATKTIAMSDPPGIEALMLDGQSTDGRTNQPRNETSPSKGDSLPVGDAAVASPNAVVHTIPTVR